MPGVITEIRKPALRAKIIDDNLNSWVDLAGADTNIDVAYRPSNVVDETSQDWWGYRGQASVVTPVGSNLGNIIRVRVGDGTDPDRQLYIQTITDPDDPTQWENWTLLYSGTHYAVAIVADPDIAAGYRVYHSKSDGLYVNNIKKISDTNIIKIKPIAFSPDWGAIYYQRVFIDVDGEREVRWYYTIDARVTTPTVVADAANYRWYKSDLLAVTMGFGNNLYGRYRAVPMEGRQRDRAASDMMIFDGGNHQLVDINLFDSVRYIRGPSEQAGFKTISNLWMGSFPSGTNDHAYFLFWNEVHQDIYTNVLSNLKMPLFWSRSYGVPYYPSAPTPVGYSVWGFAGVVKMGNYLYVCGNSRVLRRYWPPTEYDITNYVMDVKYELPRGNEKGTGTLLCANPNNDVGGQLGLNSENPAGITDQRLHLEIGRQLSDEKVIQWRRDAGWWTSKFRKIDEPAKQNLEIEFHNFWGRLENPFKDTYYYPGHLFWTDWTEDGVNHLSNYTNIQGDDITRYNPSVTSDLTWTLPHLLTTSTGTTSITLFAGWQGENGALESILWRSNLGLVFRYRDSNNYSYVLFGDSAISLHQVSGGVDTTTTSVTGSFGPLNYARVEYTWSKIKAYYDGTLVLNYTIPIPSVIKGFCGWIGKSSADIEVSSVEISDINAPVTSQELIRVLLAHIDEHAVAIDSDIEDNTQMTVSWGPQTDLDTPAKALEQLLDAAKLETAWLPD